MMPYACIGKVGVSRAHSTKRPPLRLVLKKAVATILQSLSSLLCSPPDLLLQAPLQTKHTTHHPSDTRGQFPVIPLTGVCAHVIYVLHPCFPLLRPQNFKHSEIVQKQWFLSCMGACWCEGTHVIGADVHHYWCLTRSTQGSTPIGPQ